MSQVQDDGQLHLVIFVSHSLSPSPWILASVSKTKPFPNEGYARIGAVMSLCSNFSRQVGTQWTSETGHPS